MGIFSKIIAIIGGIFLGILLMLSFAIPFVAAPILIAFASLIGVCVYFIKEDSSLSHRAKTKFFYCPFRKMLVDAKFRPSIFSYRSYDDVLKCSAFEGGVRCKKKCLNIPEIKLDAGSAAVKA